MAREGAAHWKEGDTFKELTNLFNDGVEVCLGQVPLGIVKSDVFSLMDAIHRKVPDLSLNFILPSQRASKTYLWLTPTPEKSEYNCMWLQHVQELLSAIKEYAVQSWRLSTDAVEGVYLTKLDSSQDFEPHFLPSCDSTVYDAMKDFTQQVLTWMAHESVLQIYSLDNISDPVVKRGDNNLDTCFQYHVFDGCGKKVMNIKFYDKDLDKLSREGSKLVGNNFPSILGSKVKLDRASEIVRKAQKSGRTRVEVSTFFDNSDSYRFN